MNQNCFFLLSQPISSKTKIDKYRKNTLSYTTCLKHLPRAVLNILEVSREPYPEEPIFSVFHQEFSEIVRLAFFRTLIANYFFIL